MDKRNDLYSKICRICLSVNNKRTVPLFESNGITSCYGQAIALCTKEELPHLEYAPKNMCYSCLRQLRQCILFLKKCTKSQNYFKQISVDTNLLSNMKHNVIKQLYKNNIIINVDKNDNVAINNDTEKYISDNDTNDLFNDVFDIEEEVTDTRAISERNMILQNDTKNNDNILNVIEKIIKDEVKYAKKHNHSESSNELQATITKNKRKHHRKKHKNEPTFEKSDFLSQLTKTRLNRTTSHSSEITFNNELSQINKQNNKINPEFKNLENKTFEIEIKSNEPIDIKDESKIDIFNLIRDIENKNFTLKHFSRTKDPSDSRKHKNKVKHRIKPRKKVIKAQKMICDTCSKVFANRNTLMKHLERHAGVTSFVCELCGKGFITKAELGVHLVLSHDTGRHYPCDECGYKAPRLFDLKEHRRVHTGERPFACDKCGLTFRRQYVWQQHQIYHTEKTLQCQKCPLKFHKLSALRSHENCVHERKYVYNCPICGTTYAQNKSVRRHLLETHGVARERQGKIERVLFNNVINEIPT